MKIIFFGSGRFAVPALENLIKQEYEIAAVVTQPDRKKGRHLQLQPTPVKETAKKLNLRILEPLSLASADFLGQLKKIDAQIFIVVSYGKILTSEILNIPRQLAINLHASLLPKFRGAAPINWAIIKGEKQTGVTVIKMNEYMDKGEIIRQGKIEVQEEDDAVSLEEKLRPLGAEVLLEALDLIKKGVVQFIPQQEDEASYAPRLKKEDGLIDWQNTAEEIFNRIKGLVPWPGSFTYYQGKILKIFKAALESVEPVESDKPGEILKVSKEAITVAAGKGSLNIKQLQIEGKRRMTVDEFISGHKIREGEKLG